MTDLLPDLLIESGPTDPRARPLVEDLIREYDSRYGTLFDREGAKTEVHRYPPEAFAPPDGNFLLLLREGEAVAGGAFMRHADPGTAEFKRIWTRGDLRRQGLARRIVRALEIQATRQGYRRVYLTTGFRQPEAAGLYLTDGYRPLFEPDLDPAFYKTLPFEKHIGAEAGKPGSAPLKTPDPDLPAQLGVTVSAEALAALRARAGLEVQIR
ncbi:GNAT family N-acetyltransferase [Neomegalonema perideroedes]|uniref:GNAT family N-acetyltransferase n=1 Tax=Neomegalonema perideroedes TaxID=217219 RepID=UPI00036AE540|nr:GNAT family N-acetyltransferase [Neomegalonema perideroedes]